jgi:hypothetical protein
MKTLLLSCLVLLTAAATSQVPYAKTEWCKTEGVELVTDNIFPANHAVVAYGNFFRETGITSIEQITPHIRKQMQRLAVAHHSCKVFVDFNNIVTDQKDDNGNSLSGTYIYYYAIRPVQYLAKSPTE